MIEQHSLEVLEFNKIIEQLAVQAYSIPGKTLCSDLLPARSFEQMQAELDETSDLVSYLIYEPEFPLSGLEEIRPLIGKTKTGVVLELRELNRFVRFLSLVDSVRKRLTDARLKQERTYMFFNRIQYLDALPSLAARLQQCIAGDDEIFDRATPELFSIRRKILNTQENIKIQLNRIVNNKSNFLQDALITIRSGRYVVPVKAEHRSEIPGVVHDTSGSGATVFIEPLAVVELNNKIRELEIEERDEIYRILQELSERIAQSADVLKYNADILAHLDFVQAKAKLSFQMKAISPELNDQGRIVLYNARHPLIPAKDVVPIYFELGTEFNTLVITGPNTGGKTVSLKTCGLFVLMAMAGLHIPADSNSQISFFNQVLADIGDEQSIEQNLSTFSSHLKQLIYIIDKAGPSTLVLTDELGAGTDPSEGAALAIAILDYLRQAGCHIVATTHYRELKGYALNTESVNNACCEFDDINLQPTYKLLIGVPGVSNAFKISQRLGLNSEIIAAAEQLLSDENIKFEEMIAAIEASHQKAQTMQDEIQSLQRESLKQKQNLENERRQLIAAREKAINSAQQEAADIIQSARLEVDQLLTQLKADIAQAQSSKEKQNAQKSAREAERQLSESGKKIELEICNNQKNSQLDPALTAEDIIAGEYYYSVLFNITGQALTKPDNKDQVSLKSGTLTINVPLSSLRLADKDRNNFQTTYSEQARTERNSTRKIISERKMMFESELKLLGCTVDEALYKMDEFIDNAVLANIPVIRIVHGKGTGALRQAVHNTLKQDKRIKAFRLAGPGEGDSGVTIVEF
ncbi:MAG TPA: endonuclease MutS2 [Clostridiaceae bacterium]|nr:endonuclease MutS2 [Clostridiaceae bacterium]